MPRTLPTMRDAEELYRWLEEEKYAKASYSLCIIL